MMLWWHALYLLLFPSTIFNDAKEEDQILFSIFILILKSKRRHLKMITIILYTCYYRGEEDEVVV